MRAKTLGPFVLSEEAIALATVVEILRRLNSSYACRRVLLGVCAYFSLRGPE